MKVKMFWFGTLVLCIGLSVLLLKSPHLDQNGYLKVPIAAKSQSAVSATNEPIHLPQANRLASKIRRRASELSDSQRAQFLADFEKRYRPAIEHWFDAYHGHLPFAADAVTPDKLVENIGADASFGEYVFVVDGITLGVRDSKGTAQVDYLNDPKQTRKMSALPNGAEAPIPDMPVNRQEVTQMVATDSGTQFPPNEVRMTPSGFSGALNGGELVHVGGDARNGATWKFDMVFGADGKLAYYLRGQP